MRDVALLSFYAYCVCRGLVFVFAAVVVATEHGWTIVRGLIV